MRGIRLRYTLARDSRECECDCRAQPFDKIASIHSVIHCTGAIVRIAKPLLLVTTPIGLAWGVYEAYRLAGGLVFLMIALIAVIGAAMGSVVLTVRRERREERERQAREENAKRGYAS
jgi:hypothetical protein